MKETKYIFKRYEKKFILTPEKYEHFMAAAGEHFIPDEYHESEIGSIYYDNSDFSLIRNSMEAPPFKEKLRVRCYSIPDENGSIFVELKKKYKGIVYKRRLELPVRQAEQWLEKKIPAPQTGDSNTVKEIDWFVRHNDLAPRAYIGVKRTSWVDRDESELRVTFDREIRWRADHLSLTCGDNGEPLLRDGKILMEIKIPEASPLWLARLLSDESIFPQTFSKYGTCYSRELIKNSAFAEYLSL